MKNANYFFVSSPCSYHKEGKALDPISYIYLAHSIYFSAQFQEAAEYLQETAFLKGTISLGPWMCHFVCKCNVCPPNAEENSKFF